MKLCECGCGKPTPIAKVSMPYRGVQKGKPQRYIRGHNSKCGPLEYMYVVIACAVGLIVGITLFVFGIVGIIIGGE